MRYSEEDILTMINSVITAQKNDPSSPRTKEELDRQAKWMKSKPTLHALRFICNVLDSDEMSEEALKAEKVGLLENLDEAERLLREQMAANKS